MPDFLIGRSPAIKRIKSSLKKLSVESYPLVIIGEPGVGKSLLSSRIHANSPMKDQPLACINFRIFSERDQRIALLGGSPPELPTTHRSILELPTTVVLKHIDCASQFLQEKLVETIRSNAVIRLGTTEKRPVRCRTIFVFNESLSTLSQKGRLNPALFKILTKYPTIYLPPLNKRKEDIPMLAQHFFTQFQIQRRKIIDPKFVDLLLSHKWDENILDLKAFIATLRIPSYEDALNKKDHIELTKMRLMIEERKEFSLKYSLSLIEEGIVKEAMAKYKSQSGAAKAVGLTDRGIRHILK